MYAIKDVIELTARQHIHDALQKFGVEGTEEKIKEVYKLVPRVQEYMLEIFKKMLLGE